MRRRAEHLLTISIVALALVLVGSIAYFALGVPISFQKAMALTTTPSVEPDWKAGRDLDVRAFVSQIPFRGSERVNLVRPSELFEACILQGRGNCANKSRGLSWYLTNEGIPFQRIDLLPFDGFLEGKGHALVRTRFMLDGVSCVGIVDLLEGAVPTFKGNPMDLAELRQVAPYAAGLETLSGRVDDQSDYYGSFLENLVIGVVEGSEIERYLRYLERWHVSVGNPSLERVVYAGAAIVLGFFPETHVSNEQFERMHASAPWTFRVASALTWSARALLFLVPVWIVSRGARWVSDRRRGASDALAAVPA